MKLFIAVVFLCVGDECAFWKSSTNFYQIEECAAEVQKAMAYFESQGINSLGNCLKVDLNKNT
jgi:hypothetical protein